MLEIFLCCGELGNQLSDRIASWPSEMGFEDNPDFGGEINVPYRDVVVRCC